MHVFFVLLFLLQSKSEDIPGDIQVFTTDTLLLTRIKISQETLDGTPIQGRLSSLFAKFNF